MQRYTPGRLPQSGDWQGGPAQQRISPLQAAVTLGEHVRTEHGRAGVQRFVAALAPLLAEDLLQQAAQQLGVPCPAKPVQAAGPGGPEHRGEPDMKQMLALMQAMQKGGGGGGLDPSLLMQLMQK